MKDRLQQLAAMWGEEAGRYVLVRSDPSSEEVSSFDIFDKTDRTGMIIEDDKLAAEVMRRMVAAGVPILDRVPDA
jgi:hypothetical protein